MNFCKRLLQTTIASKTRVSANGAEVYNFCNSSEGQPKTGKEIFIPVGFLTMSGGGGMPDSTVNRAQRASLDTSISMTATAASSRFAAGDSTIGWAERLRFGRVKM